MLAMVPLGRLINKLWKQEETESKVGVNSLLGALFALSGFMLAFTFGISGSRYSTIRDLIIEEGNDIGTALLRSDLYSDSVRAAFRADFKSYVDARVSYYDNVTNAAALLKAKADAAAAATSLWNRAMQQSKQPSMLVPSNNMVPALNNMFDIANTVERNLYTSIPNIIIYMLFVLSLTTSFIGGFTSSAFIMRDWLVVIVFAMVSSMVVYITLDLGRPMRGLIRTDVAEQSIRELKKSF
jgi:hypothetical protein